MPNSLLGGGAVINRPDYKSASWSLGYQKAVFGVLSDPLPTGSTNAAITNGTLQGLGDGVPSSVLAAMANAPSDMETTATKAIDQAIAVTPTQ